MISGNMVGSYSQMGKTFVITDADGNELTGVVVGQETIFTATDNDVREGSVYASNDGVSTGTKNIPMYHTTEGFKYVPVGQSFSLIGLLDYEYTKLQVLICAFNTTLDNSVATEKVSIEGKVYYVNSTDVISNVSINAADQSINLGITNDGNTPCVMRYFIYKEVL